MNEEKIRQLMKRGWRAGDAADFLHLSPDQIEFIGLKMDLARGLRSLRKSGRMTPEQFAAAIGSVGSKIEDLETAGSTVTIDEIIQAMLKAGARRSDIAQAIDP